MSTRELKKINRSSALADILDGAKLIKTWSRLAYQDIISRYRRSILGPIWVAAMMISQSIALTLVFGTIYGLTIQDFLPYIVTGISIILFIGVAFTEGTDTFSIYRPLIQASTLPLSFHIFRMCSKHFIVLLHNLVVFIVIYVSFNNRLDINLLLVPALLITFAFIFGATLFNAIISLRYNDYKFLIPHIWTLFFFLSPVMWKPEQIAGKLDWFNTFNPVYYLLGIMRAGLDGQSIPITDWIGAIIATLISLFLGYLALNRCRKQIALWV